MKVRSKIFGALTVGALTTALTLAGGGVAHAGQAATSVKPAARTVRPLADPNACTIQTSRGFYLTAVGGGGRTTDVMHTDATRALSWEKFTFVYTGDGSHYGIRTSFGYWLTAVNSGGLNTRITPDVLHTDATKLLDWEKFSLVAQADGSPTRSSSYGIRAFDGHYLSARDAGGRTSNTFDSDATRVNSWEKFYINCNV